MKNIYDFDDFVLNETVQLNEGLLSNLFGALMKKDMWAITKGDNGVKDKFKEIDDNLKGFGLTKIKNPNASQNIRQTLVTWASEKYSAKQKAKEAGAKLKEVLDAIIYKDKDEKTEEERRTERESNDTLKELDKKVENIDKKYQKELDNYTSDPELKRWANILKDKMDEIIDEILCKEFDKKGKYTKKLEKAKKKMEEELKKIDDDAQKDQKKTLEKLKKDREKVLKSCNADVVSDGETAKKFLDKVKNAVEANKGMDVFLKDDNDVDLIPFDSMFEGYKFEIPEKTSMVTPDIDGKDLGKLLGLKINNNEDNKKAMFYTLNILNSVIFNTIDTDGYFKKTLDSISGVSLQAALVSYCQLVFKCLLGETKINNKDLETCMARCAVLNNTMVGFGLPAPDSQEDAKDEDKRSLFIFYVAKTKDVINKLANDAPDNKKDFLKKCATNIDTICGEIANKAKELVKKYDEEQKQKLEKQEKERERIKKENK